jgi:hypothetical protein
MGVALCLKKFADPCTNRYVVAWHIKGTSYSYCLLAMPSPTGRKMGDHFILDCTTTVNHKIHSRTSHGGPEGEKSYSCTLSLTSALNEGGWAPEPGSTGEENLAPTGIRFPDRPARSESLYRLRHTTLHYKASRNSSRNIWHSQSLVTITTFIPSTDTLLCITTPEGLFKLSTISLNMRTM